MMKRLMTVSLGLALVALAAIIFLAPGSEPAASAQKKKGGKKRKRITHAVCVLVPFNNSGVHGTIHFTQKGKKVHVKGKVSGLKPGKHGFHVHEYGDVSKADGTSAGGHFNPTNMPHGAPGDAKRHVGDLGNITANASGVAVINMTDEVISLNGRNSIVGRGIIVHGGMDDLKSQPSGDAGPRVAGGVIGAAK